MTFFLDPPPAPPTDPVGTFAWLRASVARFSSGEAHTRRRRIVEDLLATVDPAALRARIGRRPVGPDFERRARVAVLAEALGARDDVTDAVLTVAQGYLTGEAPPGADDAVALLARQWGTDEVAANRIGLLVQTCEATAALIRSSADRQISQTLAEDPPVRATRRVAAGGSIVTADLTGHPFGAGPHACPGRDHALALAEGAVRALRKARFTELHRPLLLPNAWDHASAAALVAAGFPAIGTTSLGVAAAAGLPDGAGATRGETVRLAERLAGLPCLLTVDIEAGFSDEPAEVAALAEELAALGAAGVNIEDNVGDVTHQRELIAAAATSGLFVNARTDTHWLRPEGIDPDREAIARAQSYVDAGADGVFVPGLTGEKVIADLVRTVGVPVNILYSPTGPSFARLAELGVGRVSCGSLLFRVALDAAVRAAEAVASGEPVAADVVSYSEVASRAGAAARSLPPSHR
jgi:2-methylisocitrate lyase-like PEP mutase family enzyme